MNREPFDIVKVANEILGTSLLPRRTYDAKCYDLASAFMADHPALDGRQSELAAHIQQAIEDWIEGEMDVAASSSHADAAADSAGEILAAGGVAR